MKNLGVMADDYFQ